MGHQFSKTRSRMIRWQAALAIAIFILAIFYVVQTNNQAQYSFKIKLLEEEIGEKTAAVSNLELDLSSRRSVANIVERAQKLNLEKPASITFLEVGLSEVAVAEEK